WEKGKRGEGGRLNLAPMGESRDPLMSVYGCFPRERVTRMEASRTSPLSYVFIFGTCHSRRTQSLTGTPVRASRCWSDKRRKQNKYPLSWPTDSRRFPSPLWPARGRGNLPSLQA